MQEVYRVEDEDGYGCYTTSTDNFYHKHLLKHQDLERTPTPEHDRGIDRFLREKEICGFLNLEQANNWFTKKELKLLEGEGFELKKVKVRRITAIGEKQVLAVR
jgi:hypothetical protein